LFNNTTFVNRRTLGKDALVPASRPRTDDPRLLRLVAEQAARVGAAGPAAGRRWLLVDLAGQRLALVETGRVTGLWPVSTAAAGPDNREDSGGTPTGVHRIERRIGLEAAPGAVFVSREPTGEEWHGEPDERDLILTRVLTLEGLEDGVNRGPGVDSRARYIYIHGTNHEDRIGEPVSHGCVRMTNRDVAALADRVREGDPVVIV
jgi:UDP-N-acetylmuramate--alanine ligase